MARADSVVQTSVDNGCLTITVAGFAPIVIDPSECPRALLEHAALHGFKQKYVDAAALGAEATPREKYGAITALVLHHQETGEWNRNGAGDGTSGDGLLIRALMEAAGIDRDTARTAVSGMDKKVQAAMRASDELRPIIARIRAERPAPKASASVDVAGLLAGLRQA